MGQVSNHPVVISSLLLLARLAQAFVLAFQIAQAPDLLIRTYPYSNPFASPIDVTYCQSGPGNGPGKDVLSVSVINGVSQSVQTNTDYEIYGIALWKGVDCTGKPDLVIRWRSDVEGVQLADLVFIDLITPIGSWKALEQNDPMLQMMDPEGSVYDVHQNRLLYHERGEWVVISEDFDNLEDAAQAINGMACDIRNEYEAYSNVSDEPLLASPDLEALKVTPLAPMVAMMARELGRQQPMTTVENLENQMALLDELFKNPPEGSFDQISERWQTVMERVYGKRQLDNDGMPAKEEATMIEEEVYPGNSVHDGVRLEASPEDIADSRFENMGPWGRENQNQNIQNYYFEMVMNMFGGDHTANFQDSLGESQHIMPSTYDVQLGTPSYGDLHQVDQEAPFENVGTSDWEAYSNHLSGNYQGEANTRLEQNQKIVEEEEFQEEWSPLDSQRGWEPGDEDDAGSI
ncbi:hypothetical protein TWF694_002807 [Orbilia ellipsospora]|uniref:Uncharacterized protein n=1 Tax=Orbilia ellipsospora TaxID=2528407 RepID=A0AAV9WZS4_9PEZI